MNDESTTVSELKEMMADFIAQRDWQKYHRAKNLAMSIAIEAGELMELVQWLDHDEADALAADAETRAKLAEEMADVLSFLLSLSNVTGIDLTTCLKDKMQKNNLKYPADKVKGRYERPKD